MTHPESNSDDEGGLTEGGSGEGGTTGTADSDLAEGPAGGTQTGMVVSGGGMADPSADDGGPGSDV